VARTRARRPYDQRARGDGIVPVSFTRQLATSLQVRPIVAQRRTHARTPPAHLLELVWVACQQVDCPGQHRPGGLMSCHLNTAAVSSVSSVEGRRARTARGRQPPKGQPNPTASASRQPRPQPGTARQAAALSPPAWTAGRPAAAPTPPPPVMQSGSAALHRGGVGWGMVGGEGGQGKF
jgi:hypothetical protein